MTEPKRGNRACLLLGLVPGFLIFENKSKGRDAVKACRLVRRAWGKNNAAAEPPSSLGTWVSGASPAYWCIQGRADAAQTWGKDQPTSLQTAGCTCSFLIRVKSQCCPLAPQSLPSLGSTEQGPSASQARSGSPSETDAKEEFVWGLHIFFSLSVVKIWRRALQS